MTNKEIAEKIFGEIYFLKHLHFYIGESLHFWEMPNREGFSDRCVPSHDVGYVMNNIAKFLDDFPNVEGAEFQAMTTAMPAGGYKFDVTVGISCGRGEKKRNFWERMKNMKGKKIAEEAFNTVPFLRYLHFDNGCCYHWTERLHGKKRCCEIAEAGEVDAAMNRLSELFDRHPRIDGAMFKAISRNGHEFCIAKNRSGKMSDIAVDLRLKDAFEHAFAYSIKKNQTVLERGR